MRIGIIDLGTNSVRFDVHQIGPGTALRTLHREKIMVRLGQGVFVKGKLDPSAIQRTAHAFAIFKKIAKGLHVQKIIALGTSALREAADAEKLVESIKKSTAIDIRVISGIEEARLIALGILAHEKVKKKTFGLFDIGGGSTEVSICHHRKILHSESFQLGTARLQQVFLKKSPPSGKSVEDLRRYVSGVFEERAAEENWPRVRELIGSSGTVRALARMLRKSGSGKHIELGDLSELVKSMSKMTTTQLLGLPGLESKRVDMVLAGAILLEEGMKALGAKEVRPTEFSLRDGILEEQIDLSSRQYSSQIALHVSDLFAKAEGLGANLEHLEDVVETGSKLFDRLKGLHKLKQEWKLYLTAAIILRNCGESICMIGHAEHSYYIVKNAHFPFVEPWEAEFVAQLCLHHEAVKLDQKAAVVSKREAFSKILAMLAVVDALDAVPNAAAEISRISVVKDRVKVFIKGGTRTDLEVFRLEARKQLFEQVFRRKLLVDRASD